MNGYELSRQWFAFAFENPTKVKPVHGILYFWTIELANRLGWPKEFASPTSQAMTACGISSYNTYKKALAELVEMGFITVVQPSKNQYHACIIALSKNDSTLYKALDNTLSKHLTDHCRGTIQSTVQSTDSIIKPLTINQETINQETFNQREGELPPPEKKEGKVLKLSVEDEKKGKAPPGSAAPPEKPKDRGGLTLFRDTPFADLDTFAAAFLGTDYEYADLRYYHEVIRNWSDSKNNKKIDWIATARSWMLRDKNDGKLQLRNGTKQSTTTGGGTSDLRSQLDAYIARRNRA